MQIAKLCVVQERRSSFLFLFLFFMFAPPDFFDKSSFVVYDRKIPSVFRKIVSLLAHSFQGVIFEHVGSTAIGCGGKNVIDIVAVCLKGSAKKGKDKKVAGAGSFNLFETNRKVFEPRDPLGKQLVKLSTYQACLRRLSFLFSF